MVLDRDGNTLVLCQATIAGAGGLIDFTTLKYDPDGNELWLRSLVSNFVDFPSALDVDAAGNVFVAGIAGLPNNSSAGLAASYAPDGSLRWIEIFDGVPPVHRPADIAAGPLGELYLSGMTIFQGTSGDILTVKLGQTPWMIPR